MAVPIFSLAFTCLSLLQVAPHYISGKDFSNIFSVGGATLATYFLGGNRYSKKKNWLPRSFCWYSVVDDVTYFNMTAAKPLTLHVQVRVTCVNSAEFRE